MEKKKVAIGGESKKEVTLTLGDIVEIEEE